MPARFAPEPPPCMRGSRSRIPKLVAHSAPAYVVGTETTGRLVATETALAKSIVLPPPTASSPSASSAAAAISSIRLLGTSLQRPAAGRSSSDQRSLAISSGRSIPSSPRRLGSSRRPQRTITPPPPPQPTPLRPCSRGLAAAPRSRRPHRQSRHGLQAASQAMPWRRGLFDGIASDASRRELGPREVDERLCGARRRPSCRTDERDPSHGLLQPELEPDIKIAQTHWAPAQLVLDHLPYARPFLHQDQGLAAELLERHLLAGERVAGRHDEDHLVAEERLEDDPAVARRGA